MPYLRFFTGAASDTPPCMLMTVFRRARKASDLRILRGVFFYA